MNKRSYPYGVDMCPQLKIHVGDKEVANGVLKSTKMQEVYENTKQLLFKRAGASFEAVVQPTISEKTPRDSKPSKQLQLTFDGKLFKPDFMFENSKIQDNQQKCSFCSHVEKLDFCEKCGDIFCNMCLLSLCSDEVNKLCLSCYK